MDAKKKMGEVLVLTEEGDRTIQVKAFYCSCFNFELLQFSELTQEKALLQPKK